MAIGRASAVCNAHLVLDAASIVCFSDAFCILYSVLTTSYCSSPLVNAYAGTIQQRVQSRRAANISATRSARYARLLFALTTSDIYDIHCGPAVVRSDARRVRGADSITIATTFHALSRMYIYYLYPGC